MQNLEVEQTGPAQLTPQVVRSAEVATDFLTPASRMPLVVRPCRANIDLAGWATDNRAFIADRLSRAGAILFRNFGINNPEQLESLIEAVSGKLLDYSYRSTPRTLVSGHVYTSTEYPAHQSIPLHNENAYSLSWPMKLWFLSQQVAADGGETPLADSRKVYQRIPADIKACFEEKGLMYVRNYGTGLDLSWQDVFQTNNHTDVEVFCRASQIEFEWLGEDQLRTRQCCQVSEEHPVTGEKVWFNQAHLFHISRLPQEVREWLLSNYATDELPRNVYFADGSEIDSAMLDEIARAYEQETVIFAWRAGDVLLLDNMLTAHGRLPFKGERKIVVGMSEANAVR